MVSRTEANQNAVTRQQSNIISIASGQLFAEQELWRNRYNELEVWFALSRTVKDDVYHGMRSEVDSLVLRRSQECEQIIDRLKAALAEHTLATERLAHLKTSLDQLKSKHELVVRRTQNEMDRGTGIVDLKNKVRGAKRLLATNADWQKKLKPLWDARMDTYRKDPLFAYLLEVDAKKSNRSKFLIKLDALLSKMTKFEDEKRSYMALSALPHDFERKIKAAKQVIQNYPSERDDLYSKIKAKLDEVNTQLRALLNETDGLEMKCGQLLENAKRHEKELTHKLVGDVETDKTAISIYVEMLTRAKIKATMCVDESVVAQANVHAHAIAMERTKWAAEVDRQRSIILDHVA